MFFFSLEETDKKMLGAKIASNEFKKLDTRSFNNTWTQPFADIDVHKACKCDRIDSIMKDELFCFGKNMAQYFENIS